MSKETIEHYRQLSGKTVGELREALSLLPDDAAVVDLEEFESHSFATPSGWDIIAERKVSE